MEGSEPVGSVGLTREPSAEDGFENAPDFDDKVWYLHVPAVHPAHQRRGISSLLLSAAEDLVFKELLCQGAGSLVEIPAVHNAGGKGPQDSVKVHSAV